MSEQTNLPEGIEVLDLTKWRLRGDALKLLYAAKDEQMAAVVWMEGNKVFSDYLCSDGKNTSGEENSVLDLIPIEQARYQAVYYTQQGDAETTAPRDTLEEARQTARQCGTYSGIYYKLVNGKAPQLFGETV